MKVIRNKLKNYLSLVRFSHTIFAMPFALIGYFTAIYSNGVGFDLQVLMLVVLCMVFARNSAMGFNRYIDRNYDGLNPRTSNREIPGNIISARNALIFVIVNAILFIATTWFINMLCFLLSPVALAVILGYSITKRYTWLCHFILGIGLSLAPVGAYLAVTAKFDLLIMLYALTVMFWVGGFDIIYSLNDKEFDKKHKLHSIPSYFGNKIAIAIAIFFHIISAFFIIVISITENFGAIANIGVGLFLLFLILQHYGFFVLKRQAAPHVFVMNGIASIILSIGIILELLMIYY